MAGRRPGTRRRLPEVRRRSRVRTLFAAPAGARPAASSLSWLAKTIEELVGPAPNGRVEYDFHMIIGRVRQDLAFAVPLQACRKHVSLDPCRVDPMKRFRRAD